MRVIVNIALSMVLSIIFITPMALSFVLIGNPNNGLVAGVQSITESDVNIIPNTTSFNEYVSFSPQEFTKSEYKDTLNVTVFQRQRASYLGVYGIYNLSPTEDVYVTVSIDGEISNSNFEKIKLKVMTEEVAVVLAQDHSIGDTILYVQGDHVFEEGQRVLLENEIVEIVNISTDGLVVTPLMHDHAAGTFIENESLLVVNGLIKNPKTQTQKIAANTEVRIDVVVDGDADLLQGDSTVQIPLSIKFSRTK